MGACEIYPQTVAHNPNGRFVVVCGDGEYIIYTSMALRNKAFGSAQEFVWALESSEYAIRESSGTVKCFRNFKERKSFTPDYGAEGKLFIYIVVDRSIGTIMCVVAHTIAPTLFLSITWMCPLISFFDFVFLALNGCRSHTLHN